MPSGKALHGSLYLQTSPEAYVRPTFSLFFAGEGPEQGQVEAHVPPFPSLPFVPFPLQTLEAAATVSSNPGARGELSREQIRFDRRTGGVSLESEFKVKEGGGRTTKLTSASPPPPLFSLSQVLKYQLLLLEFSSTVFSEWYRSQPVCLRTSPMLPPRSFVSAQERSKLN